MESEAYKVFNQIVGSLLVVAGFIDVAYSWPPGDLMGWLFLGLGIAALWLGRSSQRQRREN